MNHDGRFLYAACRNKTSKYSINFVAGIYSLRGEKKNTEVKNLFGFDSLVIDYVIKS